MCFCFIHNVTLVPSKCLSLEPPIYDLRLHLKSIVQHRLPENDVVSPHHTVAGRSCKVERIGWGDADSFKFSFQLICMYAKKWHREISGVF